MTGVLEQTRVSMSNETPASNKVDYGPLTCLIGNWQGENGLDVSPEPTEEAHNPYFETLVFEPAGDVDNADSQELVSLRYIQVVTRKRDNKIFHNETGFMIWDAESRQLMQTLSIPRGLALVAGGSVEQQGASTIFQVNASLGDQQWPISQSPFLTTQARTRSFSHRLEVAGSTLKYEETMIIDIYGKQFTHTDTNELKR